MIADDRKFYTGSNRLILVYNDSKYVLTTLHSNKIEIITRKINSPYPKTPETWPYTRFLDFWLSGYCRVRLGNAAILDLSKMDDIEGAQLGSLEKLVADGHI